MEEFKHAIWKAPPTRLLCWWSAGATSAVAIYHSVKKFKKVMDVKIIYCDTGAESKDNHRFLKDCEKLYDQEIEKRKNPKFKDIWDVFEKTGYLVGVYGARCTSELKKWIRKQEEDPQNDLQVYGFDFSEKKRIKRFQENNPEVRLCLPLIEKGLSKKDCLNFLNEKKILIPEMYLLGYRNNNCIGCVKGGMGYWNKIRKDFPETFDRMARVERKMNVSICKSVSKEGERKRIFLDELSPERGRYLSELKNMQCGIVCGE